MRILRRKQVESRIGLSRSSIYAKLDKKSPQHDSSFPAPVALGGRAVGWVESEIDAWLSRQIEQSRKAAA